MIVTNRVKFGLSIILLGLAVLRWLFYDVARERMDGIFLGLLLAAVLVFLVRWENIRTFKAGGLELSLEQEHVLAAIDALGLDRIHDEQLKKQLAKLEAELYAIRGGRVLWIDDQPHKIVGERRLLRALGIQVIPAASSEAAQEILMADNDFDLLVSDVQRRGESYKLTGGVDIHEGTNFVVQLRRHADPIVRALPVVFYASYPWERLVEFTRPARELQPEPEISNSAADFVPKVIKQLARSRATPILYSPKKDATSLK